MKLPILWTAALLTSCAMAVAQQNITGKLIVAPTSACDPTATHQVEGTPLLLKSSVVDLVQWQNKMVDIGGILTGPVSCITLDVQTVATAKYQHTVTPANGFKIGTNVTFRGTGPFLSEIGLVFSVGPAFIPLGTYGAMMFDPTVYILIGPTLALLGSYSTTIQIPNDPALIGGPIQTQTFWLTVAPSITGGFVNAVGFQIQSP